MNDIASENLEASLSTLTPEDLNEGPSPFAPSNPRLQLAWDSTSLGLLKTCPRKYYYKMIENWQTRGEMHHLAFGILYHSALEEFDKAKAAGASFDEAQIAAVRKALEDGRDYIGTDDETKATKGNNKNKFSLIRAIVWYLEHFRDDPAETVILANGKPAVELSFRMELPFETEAGEAFMLSGHIDRLVEMGGQVYVLDRKTTGSTISNYYYKQFNPHNQMSLYQFASKVVLPKAAAGVIIDAAQLAVGFARFHRGMIMKSQTSLDEWVDDLERWLRLAEGYAKANHWPMNDTACGNYGGCEFQGVCSAAPSVRELLLKNDFDKKVWNPLQAR